MTRYHFDKKTFFIYQSSYQEIRKSIREPKTEQDRYETVSRLLYQKMTTGVGGVRDGCSGRRWLMVFRATEKFRNIGSVSKVEA